MLVPHFQLYVVRGQKARQKQSSPHVFPFSDPQKNSFSISDAEGRYFFSIVRVTECWHRLPREVVEFPSMEILKACGPGQPAQVPLLERGLDQVTCRAYFQSAPPCDSVKLRRDVQSVSQKNNWKYRGKGRGVWRESEFRRIKKLSEVLIKQ